MQSTIRLKSPPRYDHGDGCNAWHTSGWHPALPVVKCARISIPAPHRIPMSNINPDPFTTRPEIEGTFGVVTSTHWIATAVGMGILEKGGNAFDAGGRAAFERPRRRRADHCARHQTRPHRGDLRPRPRAGEGNHRALQERRPRDGA